MPKIPAAAAAPIASRTPRDSPDGGATSDAIAMPRRAAGIATGARSATRVRTRDDDVVRTDEVATVATARTERATNIAAKSES
jgi:hypothetical protein